MSSKYKSKQNITKRSKSMCSLDSNTTISHTVAEKEKYNLNYRDFRSRTISNSSIEVYVVNDSDTEDAGKTSGLDSGLGDKSFDEAMLQTLEQKIDKLSDLFLEQCRLLTTLKEEIRTSKSVIAKADYAQIGTVSQTTNSDLSGPKAISNGKTLLDAIESRATSDYNQLIQEVIAGFLHSDEVKDHMVQATAESVKNVIGGCVSRDITAIYLPVLEHSHKRLLRSLTKTVEDAFVELEENSATLSTSVSKISNSLRRVIDRHHSLLEAMADPRKNSLSTLKHTVEELLQNELQQWRQKVLEMFSSQLQEEVDNSSPEPLNYPLDYMPPSPPQPIESGRSVIDQLMMAAEISNQIESGDINGGFERALCAGDLALVMSACRAAARVQVFVHCPLKQNVWLSLLQQLSTDLLHDTQLKCRYIEDSILNLKLKDPITREHLPLVVGEVRKNLRTFLSSYPCHAANRRITLIRLAVDNMLK